MNLRSAVLIIFCCFGSAFFLPASAFANDNWTSVRSKNFQFVGNASESEIRLVANKLEQFRSVFTQLFGNFKFNSPIQTTVVVFKDENSFTPFKPVDKTGKTKNWVKGFFLPDYDVNYIVLTAEKNIQEDYTTIFHEYVHFLVDNTFGKTNIPPWFNEGLAEYYEQFQIRGDQKITLGNVNKAHLSLLQKDGMLPLEKFLGIDYPTLNLQPKEDVISYYAQAWVLTHYLIHGNKGQRKQQFHNFSNLLIKGTPAKSAFQEAFQTDYATMEKELRKYIEQKKFEVSITDFDKTFAVADDNFKVSVMTKAEAKAVQGDLLMHTRRLEEAKRFLDDALLLNPELSSANTTYGLVKFNEKNYEEAQKYLEKAIQNDSKNYFAFFSYAYILSRKAMTDFGFVAGYDLRTAETIRENLRKAINLNPNFAESYQLFAFINASRNEDIDEGIEMIKQALEIAPGNQMYNLRNAELLLRKKDFANARKITQEILKTASTDQLKLYALNTLNQINSWESQLREVEENKNRPKNESVITEKTLTEEEIQKLNARAMLESLNQALRRPKDGEKRILGFLTKVECDSESVIYTVKSADQTVKFRSKSVEDIALISFEADSVNSRFGCDLLKAEKFAVLTYKPSADSKSVVIGEVTTIEFVPLYFVFLDLSQIKTRTHF